MCHFKIISNAEVNATQERSKSFEPVADICLPNTVSNTWSKTVEELCEEQIYICKNKSMHMIQVHSAHF